MDWDQSGLTLPQAGAEHLCRIWPWASHKGRDRQGQAGTGSAEQAQPPASPVAALLPSGFKGRHSLCKGKIPY